MNKTQVKNHVIWSLIATCFLIAPPLQADNHGEAADALAMESSICALNDGKTIEDLDGFFKVFKKWAKKNDYNTFLTVNTPLYVGGKIDIPVLMLEFGSYQELGEGWDKIGENGQELLASLDDVVTCSRNLSHYFPMHSSESMDSDDERVLVVNWCGRHEGVSWDDINEVHAGWSFNENIGHAGLIFPALGVRNGDFPGEFGHLRVYPDAAAMLAEQNNISNEEGWRQREKYFDTSAKCAGGNAYLQSVVIRPEES